MGGLGLRPAGSVSLLPQMESTPLVAATRSRRSDSSTDRANRREKYLAAKQHYKTTFKQRKNIITNTGDNNTNDTNENKNDDNGNDNIEKMRKVVELTQNDRNKIVVLIVAICCLALVCVALYVWVCKTVSLRIVVGCVVLYACVVLNLRRLLKKSDNEVLDVISLYGNHYEKRIEELDLGCDVIALIDNLNKGANKVRIIQKSRLCDVGAFLIWFTVVIIIVNIYQGLLVFSPESEASIPGEDKFCGLVIIALFLLCDIYILIRVSLFGYAVETLGNIFALCIYKNPFGNDLLFASTRWCEGNEEIEKEFDQLCWRIVEEEKFDADEDNLKACVITISGLSDSSIFFKYLNNYKLFTRIIKFMIWSNAIQFIISLLLFVFLVVYQKFKFSFLDKHEFISILLCFVIVATHYFFISMAMFIYCVVKVYYMLQKLRITLHKCINIVKGGKFSSNSITINDGINNFGTFITFNNARYPISTWIWTARINAVVAVIQFVISVLCAWTQEILGSPE